MRILLATHQFLPEYSAGTEVLTFETAKELQRRGHQVAVFAGHPTREPLSDAERFESYAYEGIEVTRFRHGHVPMGEHGNVMALEYNNPFLAGRFERHLQETRPDIVHFFHLQRLSASAVATCHALRIPTVLTVTDYWLMCPTNQLMLPDQSHCPGPSATAANCLRHLALLTQPRAMRWLVRMTPLPAWSLLIRLIRNGRLPENAAFAQIRALSDRSGFIRKCLSEVGRILVATEFMAGMLKGYGIDPRRITLQPFGIRYSERSAPRAVNLAEPLRVGFIGTLYEHKGAHVLIEALRSMPRDMPVNLRIYGDTAQFPAYVAKLRRSAGGDDRIKFCGTFPREAVDHVMDGMDVLVVPSLWHENSPLVLLHAQAAGCPVVGSNVSGIAEIISDGVNGLLCEPGDAACLAAALTRLARDRALLAGLAGHAAGAKSMSDYVDELVHIYQAVQARENAV